MPASASAVTLTSPSGKRMHPRVQVALTVVLHGRECRTHDLSRGGFGLAEGGPDIPVGTIVDAALRLPLAGFTTVLSASARVVGALDGQARNFQFVSLPGDQRHMIDIIVRGRLAGELVRLEDTPYDAKPRAALCMLPDLRTRAWAPALRTAALVALSVMLFGAAAAQVGSRLLSVTSDYAAVAGTLRQVRAPQAGYLEETALAVGAHLHTGQVVGYVRPAVPPQAQLQVESQTAVLRATLNQQRQALDEAKAGFDNFVRTARSEFDAASAERRLLEAQAAAAQRMLQRATTLARAGDQSQERVDVQAQEFLGKQQALAAARDAELAARQKLADAQAGRFASDGRSTQKSPADIERDIASGQAQLERLEALRAGLDRPLPLRSPCDCVVSGVSATPNVFVTPGDQVADLAETTTGRVQVDALIQNQRLALVKVGQRVRVYLASSKHVQAGRVTALNFNPVNTGRVGLPDVLRSSDNYGLAAVTLESPEVRADPGLPATVMAPVDRRVLARSVSALAWGLDALNACVVKARRLFQGAGARRVS